MPRQTRATLKQYFEKRDKPTQGQFSDVIDSVLNLEEDSIPTIIYPKGQWVVDFDYVYGDIVFDNGSTYYCILDHTSSAEDEPTGTLTTYWQAISLKGDQGIQGLPGIDAKEVEFRQDTSYLQWRYVGEETWYNLIATSELVGATGTAATIEVESTETLAEGSSAVVENVGTSSAAQLRFKIPRGNTGEQGPAIISAAFSGNDLVFTLEDETTVTLTDAKLSLKGDTGDTGASITSAAFVGNDLVFTKDDASTVTLTNALVLLQGPQGETGATGRSVVSIEKTGTVGLVDTYTITYSDVTTSTFDVTNGEDGEGSGDMLKSVYDPTNINGSAFDMDNMSEGATNKILTAGERANFHAPGSDDQDATDFDIKDLTDSTSLRSSWTGKQDALGFTPENSANKETSALDTSTTKYPCNNIVKTAVDAKQATLVSGTNIKTINSTSLLGSGDIAITVPTKATGSEIDTGTDDAKFITPDAFAASNKGKRLIQIKVFDDSTALITGDGKLIFMIPVELNGMNLVDVEAYISTVSSSGTPTVQIRNITQTADMLSTRITIDASEYTSLTAATAPVIDTNNDDVATGDLIAIDVDVAGTGAKGLGVQLSFQTP